MEKSEKLLNLETSEIMAEPTLRAPVVPLALEEDKTSLCKAGCMLPSAVRLQPEYLPAPPESLNVPVETSGYSPALTNKFLLASTPEER